MFISYAQNYEDVILNRIFKKIRQGFYLDIGACSLANTSVTKAFYDKGWHGINVEANPIAFEQLNNERRRDINLLMAVSASGGKMQIDTIRHEVESLTLAQLCQEYVTTEIDFLKIDANGHEYAVLSSGDWKHFRPKVILCKIYLSLSNDKQPNCKDIDRLLSEVGYRQAYFDGLNNFYVEQETYPSWQELFFPPTFLDNFMRHSDLIVRTEIEKVKATNLLATNKIHQLELLITTLENQIKDIYGSTSWKATALLRKLSHFCKEILLKKWCVAPKRFFTHIKINSLKLAAICKPKPMLTTLLRKKSDLSATLQAQLLEETKKWQLGRRVDE